MVRTAVRACVSLALTLATVKAFLPSMPQRGDWGHKTISLSEKLQFPLVASRPCRYRRAGVELRASAMTQRTFTRSKEALEPTQTQLQHEWFDQWGFGKPDPPKEAKAGFGGGIKKTAKKGAKNKGSSPPQSAQNSQVLPVCSSPGEDLVLVFRADMEEGAKCTMEELKEWYASITSPALALSSPPHASFELWVRISYSPPLCSVIAVKSVLLAHWIVLLILHAPCATSGLQSYCDTLYFQ